MILHDIAMVAADTVRTRHYIDRLINTDLLPNYILILLNSSDELFPGQKELKTENELIILLRNKGIKYDVAFSSNVNDNKVIKAIEDRSERVFIFSGFGGTILKDKVLDTGKKFLHIHGGYLPDYKGSTTNFYSLINENLIGASAIFLTKEIDCGPIILRKKFLPPKNRTEIDYTFDSEVRAIVLTECIQNYVNSGDWEFELENNFGGEVFYIIHPVLKHLAILSES